MKQKKQKLREDEGTCRKVVEFISEWTKATMQKCEHSWLIYGGEQCDLKAQAVQETTF